MQTLEQLKENFPKDQEEMKKLSDEMILEIINTSYENKVTEKEKFLNFWNVQDTQNTNLYYGAFTSEIKKRGYVQGWYKPDISTETEVSNVSDSDKPEVINIQMITDIEKQRIGLTLSKNVANEFEKIMKEKHFPKSTLSIINDYILNEFIQKVKNNQIEFVMKF